MSGERGSAGTAVIGVVAAILLLSAAWLGVSGLFAVHQHVSAVADAAALGAADAASGFAPGEPCARAARIAEAMRASITACTLDGPEARVSAAASFLGLSVSESARAGPPPPK
ncbi:hypothetical protein HQQ80_04685 [Microbacteriaceae bacterium VKM Ac-2855]|nr:hypothetical protein [Microbacteriaceae bacterium VKM Ac-2855]